jgi:hypothetical protein
MLVLSLSLSLSLTSPNVMTADFDEVLSVPGIKKKFLFFTPDLWVFNESLKQLLRIIKLEYHENSDTSGRLSVKIYAKDVGLATTCEE